MRRLLFLFHIVGVVSTVTDSLRAKRGETPVYVETVDLSRGLAASGGAMVFGIPLSGIYHTSVHVFDMELWFHFDGQNMRRSKIARALESSSNITEFSESLGKFTEVAQHGGTSRSKHEVMLWLTTVQKTFYDNSYNIWTHNCNDFTSSLLSFLRAAPLSQTVMDVPSQILATTQGALLKPTIERAIDLMRKSRNDVLRGRDGATARDDSVVDEFLDSLANEPGPVAFIVRPIVKMMRKVTLQNEQGTAYGAYAAERRRRRAAAARGEGAGSITE